MKKLPEPTDTAAMRGRADKARSYAAQSSDTPNPRGGITAARFWTVVAEACEQTAERNA